MSGPLTIHNARDSDGCLCNVGCHDNLRVRMRGKEEKVRMRDCEAVGGNQTQWDVKNYQEYIPS